MSADPVESAPARPKGSPALIIMLVVILGPALLIGQLVGAGASSIIGGFVALFSLLATMGGALRPDLARLLVLGPIIAFGAVAPRLLVEVSMPAGFALTVLLVFVAGLLPIRGRQYEPVALGLGMGTLLGYAIPIYGRIDARQLVLAAVVGLAMAILLRIVVGLRDPSGATRKAVADQLDDPSSDFAAAFDIWVSDRRPRWLGTILVAAGRYRLALRIARRQSSRDPESSAGPLIRDVADRARTLANAVRSRTATDLEPMTRPAPLPDPEPTVRSAEEAMWTALSDAEQAAHDRDTSSVALPPGFRTRVGIAAVRSGLRHGSVQVRHAIRTAVAVLLALLVSTVLRPGDPLLPALLVTTFSIVQVSWRSTLDRVRTRFLGVLAGGLVSILVVFFLPPSYLFPISMIGLAVGMWFITARPAVGTAGILVMSVGLNTQVQHLQPTTVIIEYATLTLVGLLIGGLIGFVVVPAWRPPTVQVRADEAVTSAAEAIAALGAEGAREVPEPVLWRLGEAQAATQQLLPDHESLDADQQQSLERLRNALQDLLATAMFSMTRPGQPSTALGSAADILRGRLVRDEPSAYADPVDAAIAALAEEVRSEHDRLHTSQA